MTIYRLIVVHKPIIPKTYLHQDIFFIAGIISRHGSIQNTPTTAIDIASVLISNKPHINAVKLKKFKIIKSAPLPLHIRMASLSSSSGEGGL